MKKTYGTNRGSHGIVVKHINDTKTRLATKHMPCMLLRKCGKEEFHVGVVVAAAECMEGNMLSWAPYLLKSFLED
jgi:hypothetical protein